MQHETTKSAPLLDSDGNLTTAGYAEYPLPQYRRADIKAGVSGIAGVASVTGIGNVAIKERDCYIVYNDRVGLVLSVSENAFTGTDTVSFFDFNERTVCTKRPARPLITGKLCLPESSESGDVYCGGEHYHISFRNRGAFRILSCSMRDFSDGQPIEAEIELTEEMPESLAICTPFKTPGHFLYSRNIYCMRASGYVRVGTEEYRFDPRDSFASLDWNRGAWIYKSFRYRGGASGLDAEGKPFGFNIGSGFGDAVDTARMAQSGRVTENAIFYRGKLHKLDNVNFDVPKRSGADDLMNPWTVYSGDGRLKMDFLPILDCAPGRNSYLAKSERHLIFGRYNGYAVADGGEEITVNHTLGFAERTGK